MQNVDQTVEPPVAVAPPRRKMSLGTRLVWHAVRLVVLFYVLFAVTLYFYQDQMIFMPSPRIAATPDQIGLRFDEFVLDLPDAVRVPAWLVYAEEPPRGTVIFFHGNAENLGDLSGTARTLGRMGFDVLLVEYPGYGAATGAPSERGFYAAADAGWRLLVETRGHDPRRIVAMGRSIGGAVAIELAYRREVGALVTESTFSSLVAVGQAQYPFMPIALLARHRFDSIAKAPHIRVPKLFFHGDNDTLIPPADGQRLFDAAAEPKTRIVTRGGHNDAGFEADHETTERLRQWLAQVIPPRE